MSKSVSFKVVIAEDDFLVSLEIQRIVKTLGYQVLATAANGQEAVDIVCQHQPDVVLMDINMPKMNGIEAAYKIQGRCPCPVVILTAHESFDFIEEASVAGVGAYLTKPPKPEEIERAIKISLARFTDLKNSRKYILELQKKEKELEQINATKDKFMSIIAHDLRGPIGALMAFSDQLEQDIDHINKNELKVYLHNFHLTSKGVYDLLENLLYWSRLQVGSINAKAEVVNVKNAMESVCALLSTNISNKEIEISIQTLENINVLCDKNMLSTVLRNLITNAIKYTPKKGRITLSAKAENKTVHFNITDTGIGMSDEDIINLFRIDKSFSYKGTEGEAGSGLGLIICHELVNKMGGKINVTSKLGHGTQFTFTVPAANS